MTGVQTCALPILCASGNSVTVRVSGSVGSIQWQRSTDNVNFSAISGATSATYSTTNLTATTYYRARVKSGVCDSLFTNTVTVAVNPASVSGSISGAATVCYQNNSTLLTLNGYTGTIQWQSSTTSTTAGFNNVTDSTANTFKIGRAHV